MVINGSILIYGNINMVILLWLYYYGYITMVILLIIIHGINIIKVIYGI